MTASIDIARVANIPWEARVNVDGWPCRAGLYVDDREHGLCMRLIDYPIGSVEPRHVHAGMHATTVLEGRAIVDGVTLGPLDVVLGPSNEPHGPLHYPDGCKLLSAFQGSYHHSESQQESAPKHYRLIQSAQLPWQAVTPGSEARTLVDHGCGQLLVEVFRFRAGTQLEGGSRPRAGLIVEGDCTVNGETLGRWDLWYAKRGVPPAGVAFPHGATVLSFTLRE
jgi:hypothetical protein